MKTKLTCGECGGNRFSLAQVECNEALILCEDCSEPIGTLGDLKAIVAGEVG